MNTVERAISLYGVEYLLRQCAEECNELAHANLKYIRAHNDEAVGVNEDQAIDNLIEEIADVILCMNMVCEALEIKQSDIETLMGKKLDRFNRRMDEDEFDIEDITADILRMLAVKSKHEDD